MHLSRLFSGFGDCVSLISLSYILLLLYRNEAVLYIFCIQQVYSVHDEV